MSDKGYPEGGSRKPTDLPYFLPSEGSQDFPLRMGGMVLSGLALIALNVGDIVFYSTTLDSWSKSVTVANYTGLSGVVVGGILTADSVVQQDSAIGVLPAAGVGQRVLVMVLGIAKVLADVALATLNTRVTGGAVTAGRASTTGAAAGNFVGATLDTAAGAGNILRIAVGLAR